MSSDRINLQTSHTVRVFPDHSASRRPARTRSHHDSRQLLRVMKFGGTSVGDAACIRRVAEITKSSARDGELVIVVSAMSGVTNKLIEMANQAQAKNQSRVQEMLEDLRQQHQHALQILVYSETERNAVQIRINDLIDQCAGWCQSTAASGELTPRMSDSISGLGERLSVLLVAAALRSHGMNSEGLEASDLIVTDSTFGSADPKMQLTTERCESRLLPLLRKGVIPVVTGFIAADEEGSLTTLGRGGSDYTATIVGSAIKANEVIIWTDVDGILTADPRLVPSAVTIPEISYREASELAHYGAKVLHPKTLRPVMEDGIPVWIRNTFSPAKRGTKITPIGNANWGGVKALTAIKDAALIKIGEWITTKAQDVLPRVLVAAKAIRVDVLLIAESPSKNEVSLVIRAAEAARMVEVLRDEFRAEVAPSALDELNFDSDVSIVTAVGENPRALRAIVARAGDELSRKNVPVLVRAQGASACNVSFLVLKKDFNDALLTTHQEVERSSQKRPQGSVTHGDSWPGANIGYTKGEAERPFSGYSTSTSISDDPAKILDEETFRSMIAYERKRTERSRKPVLLMLLETGDSLSGEANSKVLGNVLTALSQATRDTDITGWYRSRSVVGVMFTETGMDDSGAIMATMMHRVGETLRFNLSLEKASQVNISLHVFPESWNQEASVGNPRLYPDLEHRDQRNRRALTLKRVIDVVGSLAAITFFAPIFALVACLVKLGSRGPVLFKQERIGQFGKPFTFLKFRSMYANNDPTIHQQFMKRVISGDHKKGSKMENDPRITRVGRFLRKSSLDELPQFFSVLKGDMSLVGPRPPLPYEVEEYDIWHRRRVLEVKPGITGLWQVTGRSRLRFDEMVRLDLQYVRTWSPWLDLKILFRTPIAVIRGGDAF
jgi:aspartate kinase